VKKWSGTVEELPEKEEPIASSLGLLLGLCARNKKQRGAALWDWLQLLIVSSFCDGRDENRTEEVIDCVQPSALLRLWRSCLLSLLP